jgi:glycosyltransferase involved in cell wall biosynthesis
VKALQEAIALTDEERQAMGARGHQLVVEKYTWPSIGKQMAAEYEKLL